MASKSSERRVLAVGTPDAARAALDAEGFHVEDVPTVEACLDGLRDTPIDAVVTDHDLPDGDAIALTERMTAVGSDAPCVVYTGDGSEGLAGRLLACGVAGYVPHSAGPDVLVDRVIGTLERDAANSEPVDSYRHLLEVSPVPINLFDEEGVVVYGNDATLDLLGLDSREALVGRSIFEFIHPVHRETAEAELSAVVEKKRPVGPTRMDLLRPDGEVRHIQVATAPGRYEGKDIGQAVVVDVTELRDARRALEEERRFIDDALDTLPDIFFFVAPDGTLERWNETATAVCGYDDEDLAEMALTDLFVAEDIDAVFGAIETVLSEGQATVEAHVATADGRTIPHEFRGRRLGGDRGPIEGVVGIGRDVSDRQARDRQLRTIDRMLRHNLRNALTTIGGRAETIRATATGEVVDSADVILRTSEALLATADKERTVVHLLTDRPDPVTTDVADVARTVAGRIRERHPQATVDLQAPDTVRAVAVPDLDGAVLELLDNAIRHADESAPAVEVTVERAGTSVLVHVRDTGPPIPEMEVEAVRDLTWADDQLSHGQGIGLWLVELVVTLSSGTLTFGTNDPSGNVVTIELPSVPGAGR